jgi:hypothetical protein
MITNKMTIDCILISLTRLNRISIVLFCFIINKSNALSLHCAFTEHVLVGFDTSASYLREKFSKCETEVIIFSGPPWYCLESIAHFTFHLPIFLGVFLSHSL